MAFLDALSEDGPYPIWGTGGIVGYAEEYLYDKPSVILGRKGTIDRPYMSAEPFWAIDTTFYTEIKDGIDPQWLYQRFLLIPWYKFNEASGVPSLSRETIYKIRIDVPDMEEQRKIATVLNEVDKQVESLVRISKNFEEQKRGLMQKLLTGQIRVKATCAVL
jgi:type I restriction enzyme S subunit